jgi:hypothetical protein
LDECGTAGRAGCAVGRTRWTTGDRRTDAFVVLLVVAGGIVSALLYAVDVLTSGALGPTRPFADRSAFGLLCHWAAWAARSPGAIVPLLLGLAALVRVCAVRPAVILATICVVVGGLTAVASDLADMVHAKARGIGSVPPFWICAFTKPLSELWPCFVPLAVVLVICLAGAGVSVQPRRIGAKLTRVTLAVEGAALVVAGVAFAFSITRSYVGTGPWTKLPDLVLFFARDMLYALSGVALIVCARCAVARDRISPSAIWAVAGVQFMRWALGSVLDTAAWAAVGPLPDIRRIAMTLVSSADPLVATTVLLWYWWPVLRGRASPALDPDVPHCTRCGYNLTGNVSGVCPECGTPAPLVVPTSA